MTTLHCDSKLHILSHNLCISSPEHPKEKCSQASANTKNEEVYKKRTLTKTKQR